MDKPLTLSDRQRRLFIASISWYAAGLGVIVGASLALLIGGTESAARTVPLLVPAMLLGIALFFIGTFQMIRHSSAMSTRLTASVDAVAPTQADRVPAVLDRVIAARGKATIHQLLYVAHTASGVMPVAVVLRAEESAPHVGSGAWLLIDPARPDVATIDPRADAAEHASAREHPALASPTRAQRGVAVPGRVYAAMAGVLLGTAGVLFAVLTALGAAPGSW